ncbi:hypothetical protein HYW75_04230 [Candidatus Pacearchaeota archaeon]|nr:hypothetical protein [Candidatus Pacearchaeota archaeon]
MRQEKIEKLLKEGKLRIKERNIAEARAIINIAKLNAEVMKDLNISEKNSTVIYKEIYDSIRQLGDIVWLLKGYEVLRGHEISLEILKELDIKERAKLNFLNRFEMLRHDASYRGKIVSVEHAKEIVDFWNTCSGDIIKEIEKVLIDNQ